MENKINRTLIIGLIGLLALFLLAHILTINYPYHIEDEAYYRIIALDNSFVQAGLAWKVYIYFIGHLPPAYYRYICAVELTIVAGVLVTVFARAQLIKTGMLAALLFLASPMTFIVSHWVRPETYHTCLAALLILCCSGIFYKNHSANNKNWINYLLLICAMLLNLALPHAHMFGLVHVPATYFLIMLSIIFFPANVRIKLCLGLVFTGVELGNIFYFLTHGPDFKAANVGLFERIQTTLVSIYHVPGSMAVFETAARSGNKLPVCMIKLFSTGGYLRLSTALLLCFGIIGALITFIRGICIRSFDIRFVAGCSVLIFFATFFLSILKASYYNVAYVTTMLPWAAVGCALGILFFTEAFLGTYNNSRLKLTANHFSIKTFTYCLVWLVALAVVASIVFFGLGQIYTYSWPLRYSSFADNVTAIQAGLLKNNCTDVPYISSPYQAFVSMRPQEKGMQFAQEFIVTVTTNLAALQGESVPDFYNTYHYTFDPTLARLNKGGCVVVTERELFSLGAFGAYANLKAQKFFIDNFVVLEHIQLPFFYRDPFPSTNIKKFGYDVTMGDPFLFHGGMEGIFILKAKRQLNKQLIAKYS